MERNIPDFMDIDTAINYINDVLHSDSGFRLDRNEVRSALRQDINDDLLKLPSMKEVEILVYGDDTGGIPKDIVLRYPRLHAFISAQF